MTTAYRAIQGSTGTYTLTVAAGLVACTCPGFRYRTTCRHSVEAAAERGGVPAEVVRVTPAPVEPGVPAQVGAPYAGQDAFWALLEDTQPF